jgi:UDP-N-acetyl-D-galactosamine dehydrogenase
MPSYIAKKTVQKMSKHGKSPSESRVLVMGATFKEGVSDVRNSKVAELVKELIAYSLTVDVVDPIADEESLRKEYNISLKKAPDQKYDAIIMAVAHEPFLNIQNEELKSWANFPSILVDIKGFWKSKSEGFEYWSL